MSYTPLKKFKKSFCFISQTARLERPIIDGSVRYRCFHVAEELRIKNYYSVVTTQHAFLNKPCFDYDVYIFHRPHRGQSNAVQFDSIIKILKQSGKTIIADYDDLIFGDATIAEQSSIVKNNNASIEDATRHFTFNLAGLLAFDRVTTSTRVLAQWVKHFNPTAEVKVLPNFIPTSLLNYHGSNQNHLKLRKKGTIGYFAGTKSHDKDFPVILEPVYKVLVENPTFELLVVGPVKVPTAIAALDNVIVNPVLDYFRLPSLMWNCETVIAPLEWSEFNDCKSRVKFLEAALAGCRLVATPITDMVDIGENYINLARTSEDWYEMLSLPPSDDILVSNRISNFEYIASNKSIAALLEFSGE